ncbi:dihydrodipicolinate synthetase [Cantharellus anzutake]|uniref:dihydrodipicolinate synthetase n=1 Tax=Cantharellus anzutake TaxID=1750568 RepID=UPI0019044A53|nr:dihydrodipicolinate synthetase [Cantharellus anzutake]KAF8333129.1 dihydrodipicolinate synthetase [Cantharellus anzutake]
MSSTTRPRGVLGEGIYVPTLTFFKDDQGQSLDIGTHKRHILWMARAGVHGFLLQGSTAEAVAINREERIELIKVTRQLLDENGFQRLLIIAGAGAQSTLEAVTLSIDAANAGADYVIVLSPGYFASSITPEANEGFYREVADYSPIPVIIYSYPSASGGLEISSDSVVSLAKHPNIVGIKQTDHNVGKMARIVYQVKKDQSDFVVLGGASEYLVGALAVGASGVITGAANICPRAVMKLYHLWLEGKSEEARNLQGMLSVGEGALLTGGIPAIKAAAQLFLGRGGVPRRPVPPPSEALISTLKVKYAPLYELEQRLEAQEA